MSGRRSHVRFEVVPTSEGVLRILRDVVVIGIHEGEITVLSREPGIVGETLHFQFAGAPETSNARATVVESRPVIVDGIVRHRLRLQQTGSTLAVPVTDARQAALEQ